MPKGGKVSIVDQREWLDRYEAGKTLDQIAREAKRSTRTVQNRIAKAQEERERNLVRAQVSRAAYEGHFRDLLTAVEDIGERADDRRSPGLVSSVDRQQRLLHESLKEHIPRSSLWEWCQIWEHQVAGLAQLDRRLSTRIVEYLDSQLDAGTEGSGINLDGFFASFLRILNNYAERIDSPDEWYRRQESEGGHSLFWGSHLLANVQSWKGLDIVQQLHDDLRREPHKAGRDLVSQYVQVLREWLDAREGILEEVTLLRLRRILPGECRICSGADSASKKRSRSSSKP